MGAKTQTMQTKADNIISAQNGTRSSMRLRSKLNNKKQNNVINVFGNLLKADIRYPSTCSLPTEDNLNRTDSNNSVIYVKTTYYSGFREDIPLIDLTESTSSIESTASLTGSGDII